MIVSGKGGDFEFLQNVRYLLWPDAYTLAVDGAIEASIKPLTSPSSRPMSSFSAPPAVPQGLLGPDMLCVEPEEQDQRKPLACFWR